MLVCMDSSLQHHLDTHRGVISARAAYALGLTPNQLRRLVRRGDLVHVVRGAYVDAVRLREGSPEAQHLLRLTALVLSRRGVLFASHQSSALVWGLPVLRSELEPLRVVHATDRVNTRKRQNFTIHPSPGPEGLTTRHGIPVVSVPVAVIGTAMLAGPQSGLIAADAALRQQLTTRAELHDWLPHFRHHLGISCAQDVIRDADPSAESPGESLLRVLLRRLGYAAVPQHQLRDADGIFARVDFFLPELGVVVEFDGRVKYEGHDGKDALAREKQRERRIERLGYGVARIVWADLLTPARVEREIRAAMRHRLRA